MGLFSFLFDQQAPTTAGFMPQSALPKSDPNAPIDPGMSVPRQDTTSVPTGFSPQDDNPLARQLGPTAEFRNLPHMENQPGLLHKAFDYVKSPQGMMTLGTALRASGGDEGAFQDQARMQQSMQAQRDRQEQLEHRSKANAAFKVAYQNGKFDPQAYTHAMSGDPLFDASDVADLQKTFAPKTGVDGSYAYSIDPDGHVNWGEQRPMSHAEEAQIAREAEAERRNQVLERLAQQRLGYESERVGISRGRERRLSSGGGGSASGVPALPPGFVVEK